MLNYFVKHNDCLIAAFEDGDEAYDFRDMKEELSNDDNDVFIVEFDSKGK